jgi:hypothetical protein
MAMKVSTLGIVGLVTLSIFTSSVMSAEKQTVEFGLSADYYSKYIWRGQNINNSSVLQPTVSASAYGFTGSLWGNLDLTNDSKTAPDNAWEFSEFDWGLDYSAAVPGIENLNFSLGALYYRLTNQVLKPTTELYSGLSLSDNFLSPSFKWYRDVDEIKGSYFEFAIGHAIEKIYTVNEKCYCGLQLGASYGWGNAAYDKGYFGVNSGQSNDLTLTAGLPFCIDTWTIKPSINYSSMLSKSIREATDKSDNFWVGLGVSTSF